MMLSKFFKALEDIVISNDKTIKKHEIINIIDDINDKSKLKELNKVYISEYKIPSLACDMIVHETSEDKVLLIRRASNSDAFPGCYALPGGFFDCDTDIGTKECAIRELYEETNLSINTASLFQIADEKNRDTRDCIPSKRVISIVYFFKFDKTKDNYVNYNDIKARSDADKFMWVELSKISSMTLAFDHNIILKNYLRTH